jgi:hypothetical protein
MGLGMKVARRPCFSATDLTMNLKKRVLVGGGQRVVELPVHLELAVGVLVVVLVRPPAELQHVVADFAHHVIAAHHRLLVVAGLFGRIEFGSEISEPSGGQQEELRLDAGLDVQALASGLAIRRRRTLRGAWATSSPSITQLAATHATSGFQGSWMTEAGSGTASMSGCAGVMSSQVAKTGEACAFLLHVGNGLRRDQLGALPPNRSVKES